MRSQADSVEQFAEYSDEAAISFPVDEDRTRQEFKADADLNVILRRFGAGGFEPRPVVYGTQDFDVDLQQAYLAAAEAQAGWDRLPERLRKRYPGWGELISAIEAGEASLVDPSGVVADPPPKDPVVPVSG